MSTTQLSQIEGIQIWALLKARHRQAKISRILNRSASTISRETNRNKGKRGYRPKQANTKAQTRKENKSNLRICEITWKNVTFYSKKNGVPNKLVDG